ncbi:MAG: RNA pseudouridine synthase [Bacteroidetes bacterium]|nr:RNA pseudouridine synthase [Bacteroidota bacterium]
MKKLNPAVFNKEQIVYEDNHILIINKIAGQIVQGDKTGDIPLSELIKNFIKQRDNKPGNVFCGVIHRLDRPVSGLVIFAKTSKALSRFNELFKEKKIEKKYLAVVKQKPKAEESVLTHYLIKNEKYNTSKAFKNEIKNSLKAILHYKLIASSNNYHLLQINLETGRHHQIRCQLAAEGMPIKGDVKYGFARPNEGGYLHLHSHILKFIHPIKQEEITVNCLPLTTDVVWDFFIENKCI